MAKVKVNRDNHPIEKEFRRLSKQGAVAAIQSEAILGMCQREMNRYLDVVPVRFAMGAKVFPGLMGTNWKDGNLDTEQREAMRECIYVFQTSAMLKDVMRIVYELTKAYLNEYYNYRYYSEDEANYLIRTYFAENVAGEVGAQLREKYLN